MQFKVPQDVQREDTIIGPITLKQLIILGVGGGIAYAIYVSLSKTYYAEIYLPPVAIVAALTLAFAFLKVYSLPFHEFLMHFIEYHLLPKQRIWIQGAGYPLFLVTTEKKKEAKKVVDQKNIAKKQRSLAQLTKVLDTSGQSEIEENAQEISKDEKKAGLKELIKQNYK